MKHGSLQRRILLTVLAVVLPAWVATFAMTWADAHHELDELLDAHLAQAAALLVVQQARDVEHAPGLDAPILHRYAPRVAFQVYHEGRLSMRSSNAPTTPLVGTLDSFEPGYATVEGNGAGWRVFTTYGAANDVLVYVGERMDSRSDILRAILHSALWPLLVGLPLLGLAIWAAVGFGAAPLRRLGETLSTRRPDALQALPLEGIPREMVPMVEALNGLFGRIEHLLENERRFTADAAHELRTPVAAIRAQAQVALNASEDAQRRHALQATLAGCDRAAHLIEQLLTLSRLEADATPAMQQVDLAALARTALGECAALALAHGKDVEMDDVPPCPIRADATLLQVLLRNLLDNAERYTPAGARIALHLAAQDGQFMLMVEDSGPGVPDEALSRLGQRFFRAAENGESGSGLGWSIARRIATAHGFTLEAKKSAALGGLAVTLRGPLAGSGPA